MEYKRTLSDFSSIIYAIFLCRTLFMRYVLHKVVPFLCEMADGLRYHGVLQKMSDNPNTFEPIFVPGKSLEWTFENVEEVLDPNYSVDGSNKKSSEINTFKCLLDAVEQLYHSGIFIYYLRNLKGLQHVNFFCFVNGI